MLREGKNRKSTLFRSIRGYFQIPMFAIMSLGCYGLGALGYGMMVFRVCPEEEILLQKDIAEAKAFFKERGVDMSAD
ncbi:dolichol-phosphate mannose synthase subunit 3 isoform X2 [Physcomitrium patens]|uniref:dolichol-phosphate mannose synthase subunit 3 isoform X2 n=1 Tax=Physcomitrium patens TaxID=3218 RepID=UPI000D17BF31|nr:dolichol-phosphate mannose synthase subunit 3-like isoform X2 [Physcomitrium patens]|eukprot:XP_024357153.1 dolichol-phosphate mannose synthase subunit 3-like isoform X2 [Physcomitrella patens]